MLVRDATEADLPGILAIYNEVIRTSSAVYIEQETTLDDRLHERLGFEQVGLLREVGTKFGRWLDLVFMQRFLDAGRQTASKESNDA